MRKLALLAAAAVAALAVPMAANAALVVNSDGTITVDGSTSGGTATIDFDGNVEGVFVPGLTGQLQLTFGGVVGGDYTFSYTLINNSTVTSRISGLAFNTDPNVTGGTASGLFANLVTFNQPGNQTYPNGIGAVEVCLQSGGNGNSCAGGGNGGVWNGFSGTGSFTLDFGSTTPTMITLSSFYDRYQSIVGVQGGTSGTGTGTVQQPLPEPGTWAMMLLGFGVAGIAIRRSRTNRPTAQFA